MEILHQPHCPWGDSELGPCPGGGLPTWSHTFNFSEQFCEVVGYYYLNFTDEEMEFWRGSGLCLRLHSQKGTEAT